MNNLKAWATLGVVLGLSCGGDEESPVAPVGTGGVAGGTGGAAGDGGTGGTAGGISGGSGGTEATGGSGAASGQGGTAGAGAAGGGSCGTIFTDSFEQGLAAWTLAGANHEQSADVAHTGQFAHKVWDEGTLDEIAFVDFAPPTSNTLYVGFWWLVDGSYADSPGKLGRLVSAGLTNQLEMWCSTGSWSPGVHWYGGASCGIDPEGLCCRYPSVNQQTPQVWHHNEVFIEYASPGQTDGRFRQWIDRPSNVPLSMADAYLTADESNTRFIGEGACELPYNSLRLPTNIDGQFIGGVIYYDDVEIRDCLP